MGFMQIVINLVWYLLKKIVLEIVTMPMIFGANLLPWQTKEVSKKGLLFYDVSSEGKAQLIIDEFKLSIEISYFGN